MIVVTLAVGFLAYRQAATESSRGYEATLANVQGDRAQHPLVGSWIVARADDVGIDSPQLLTFTVGGAVLASDATGQTGHGAWEASGDAAADFSYVTVRPGDDGTIEATTTVTGTVDVDPAGDGWTGFYMLARAFPGGSGEASPESTLRARRITPHGIGPVVESPEPGEPGYAPATPEA